MSQQRQNFGDSDAEFARRLQEQEGYLEDEDELSKVMRLSAQEASTREALARTDLSTPTTTSTPESDGKAYNPSSSTSIASRSSSSSSNSTSLSRSTTSRPTTSSNSTSGSSGQSINETDSESWALARKLQEEEDLKYSQQLEEGHTSRRGRRFAGVPESGDVELPTVPASGPRPLQAPFVHRVFHQPGGHVSFMMSSNGGGPQLLPMMHMQHGGLHMNMMHQLFSGGMMPFPMHPSVDVDNMSYEELLELGERLGQVKRGAPVEAITQLPTSKFRRKAPAPLSTSAPTSTTTPAKGDKPSPTEAKAAPPPSEEKGCCICLDDFQDGEDIRRLPCFHIFHQDEIDKWLRDNNSCPICKTPIPTTAATESET